MPRATKFSTASVAAFNDLATSAHARLARKDLPGMEEHSDEPWVTDPRVADMASSSCTGVI
ncbi:MAG: hypothetical protein WA611_14550 [Candidatus Acidiferrales bacterium]